MRIVGVKSLKDRLSEYLRLVAAGETVLVTQRDRVVAELRPPSPGRSGVVEDAVLAEALRSGWLRAPLLSQEGPPPRLPVMSSEELDAMFEGSREDR